ncbi:tetratricopeptide repeat protein [Desulfovibrio legallii]|uniref:Uncharacterized protein n=1 Tax=Desulfovibrio legallii TaxID=571438 RepID=A0A6H3FER1_9BACT|nr:tetratricopeptide repeat protein [Desulfovibrio legallii]RHH26320.1 hypothetical protein DW219_01960 [Desulfovibrio sp. AM18-2]TBH81745.1 hypothetical protein EB812_00175 [Desulfovibrio legallii]CAI3226954.1 hypothetical protein DWUX_825 [Desulfovibrio diazotrophicus]
MNISQIRLGLGRVKSSCARRDLERALDLAIAALDALGGQTPPTDLRGDIRNAVASLAADPDIRAHAPAPLAYQPGMEQDLARSLRQVRDGLKNAQEQEDYAATLQRKQQLDRWFKDGKAFLAQGKPSEADACFAEALRHYRDETALFGMMAKAMMEAGEYVRALGHIRAGLKANPGNAALADLAEACASLRQQGK